MRRENSIDFWRGYAIICIFINHIPGIRLEHFTLRAFSLADSAEMFVFFAGYAVNIASRGSNSEKYDLIRRFSLRALDIYQVHLISICGCTILLTQWARYFGQPEILSWMRLPELLQDPLSGILGIVMLTGQLQFFDILPLYVCLLLAAPLVVAMARLSRLAVLLASFALYAVVTITHVNFHQWPGEEDWFFNPLAWQFIFVLGYLCASKPWQALPLAWLRRPVWLASLGVVASAFALHRFHLAPDPVITEGTLTAYFFNKTFLGPARLIDFLALVFVFRNCFPCLVRHVPAATSLGCLLGRNSLPVFCVGSFLSVFGQLARFETGGPLAVDLAICALGIPILLICAKVAEWQKHKHRAPTPAKPYLLPG